MTPGKAGAGKRLVAAANRRKLEEALSRRVRESPGNRLATPEGSAIYDEPLLGLARAGDPLFDRLREVGAPDHRSPGDWLSGARTVISYFLPFSRAVRESNRTPGLPSAEWCSARIEGEALNDELRRFLVARLEAQGFRAVAPPLTPAFRVSGLAANWSERHVAYIAGLGTFGLSASLITRRGSAGRFGSVVTDWELEPDPRPDGPHYAYCPWLSRGECGDCIARCPAGAIGAEGKDKERCRRYLDEVIKPRFAPRYGCAKCQTGVSCEAGLPG